MLPVFYARACDDDDLIEAIPAEIIVHDPIEPVRLGPWPESCRRVVESEPALLVHASARTTLTSDLVHTVRGSRLWSFQGPVVPI